MSIISNRKPLSRKKNLLTDKKYVLWKINLKFPNLKFNLSWIIAYILIWNVNFDEKCEPFVVIKKPMRPFWDKWN